MVLADEPTAVSGLTYECFEGSISDAVLHEVAALMAVCFEERTDERPLERRVRARRGAMLLVARSKSEIVAFKLGYERNHRIFSSWLGGVHPDWRRRGVARELMRRQHAWAKGRGYRTIVTETTNQFKSMLILDLVEGFDIVGSYLDERGIFKLRLRKRL